MTAKTLSQYTIHTDAFDYECECESLDEAIELAFAGEGLGKITDLASLRKKFAKYVADGGWCQIERDDEVLVTIGDAP